MALTKANYVSPLSTVLNPDGTTSLVTKVETDFASAVQTALATQGPAVAQQYQMRQVIFVDQQGKGKTWGLSSVIAPDQTPFTGDNQVIALPSVSFSALWSSVPTNQRNRVNQFLQQQGLTLVTTAQTTVGQVMLQILQSQEPAITSPDQFDPAILHF